MVLGPNLGGVDRIPGGVSSIIPKYQLDWILQSASLTKDNSAGNEKSYITAGNNSFSALHEPLPSGEIFSIERVIGIWVVKINVKRSGVLENDIEVFDIELSVKIIQFVHTTKKQVKLAIGQVVPIILMLRLKDFKDAPCFSATLERFS
jgi:hypothetical protein